MSCEANMREPAPSEAKLRTDHRAFAEQKRLCLQRDARFQRQHIHGVNVREPAPCCIPSLFALVGAMLSHVRCANMLSLQPYYQD